MQRLPFGSASRSLWRLEDSMAFLNNGSFGATPRRVLAAQATWRDRLEDQPVRFLAYEAPHLVRGAAAGLARFLGARPEDLVFVDNATTGVNAVLGSVPLRPGDEIVTTTHAYAAVRFAMQHVAARAGARVVEAVVPFPIGGPDEVVDAVAGALTDRTKLLVVDHVTSVTGLVLPVERLVALGRARGVPVLVDGAHAPGMVALDVPSLGADWYTGNCHKWLFAPKGCAFLWARAERQPDLHPPVISNGYGQGWLAEFDWTGTRDPSAWLSVGAGVAFAEELGLDAMRSYNRDLAAWAGQRLAEVLGSDVPSPASMRASLTSLLLPGRWDVARATALHDELWRDHRVEVFVFPFGGRGVLRVSAQVYNEAADYERLASVLGPILAR
jgi:isopenicillin-N epimerase